MLTLRPPLRLLLAQKIPHVKKGTNLSRIRLGHDNRGLVRSEERKTCPLMISLIFFFAIDRLMCLYTYLVRRRIVKSERNSELQPSRK